MSRPAFEQFVQRVGSAFKVGDTEHSLTLDEASALKHGDGFSLVFKGVAGLAQGTHVLTCETFSHAIFIVPIGPESYEAVFN